MLTKPIIYRTLRDKVTDLGRRVGTKQKLRTGLSEMGAVGLEHAIIALNDVHYADNFLQIHNFKSNSRESFYKKYCATK